MTGRRSRAALTALSALVCLVSATASGARLPARAAVGAYLLGPRSLVAGSTASYRIAVHWASAPEVSGPLPGARVELTLVPERRAALPLARGTSDASGSAHLTFTVPRQLQGGRGALRVKVASALGQTESGCEVQIVPGARLLVSSDKNLYQPGQTIHARLLALRGMDLRPLAGAWVMLQIKDPKGNVVALRRQRTSRFGIASLDLQLADEINLGRYSIEAWSGADGIEQGSRVVEVKRYVLPKIKVSIETDRPYYAPGDTVRGSVRARYFFGKPVRGSLSVKLLSRTEGPLVTTMLPASRLDAEGRATFEARVGGGRGVGELRVLATVTDDAGQRQDGDASRTVTSSPLSVSLASENSHLVPGLRNRVHVVAGYPDGRPAVGATVELRLAGQRLSATTDALGTASLGVLATRPRPKGKADAEDERSATIQVEVKDRLGQRAALSESVPVARWQAVLIRPARALIPAGAAVEAELLAPPASRLASGEQIFVDVVKSGQTLATFTRRLGRASSATVSFQPSAALFGLLELRAYRLATNGERVGTSRLVYVDHPGELQIQARADRSVYRPGERARVSFLVKDSRSGEGVEAALGLCAIDDAVVALGGRQESTPKVFFTLAGYVWRRGSPLPPDGRDLAGWVMGSRPVTERARALEVLLAAAKPVEVTLFETNPWQERQRAWERQAPPLIQAARSFMRDHSVGEKRDAGWRFASDLVPRLAAAGVIRKEQAEDPWRRVVRPWHLRAVDPDFVFAKLATPLAREKLEEIYQALAAVWDRLNLPRERVPGLPARKQPLIFPRDLLGRLVKRGALKPSAIVDPWGQPYRILRTPQSFVNPYYTGLVTRTVIHSAGPDGISGTKDDIGPAGPRRSVRVFGRDAALGSDAADALGGLIGNQIGEAYGVGGLGLIGHGSGGGGSGYGSIGLGRIGTIGHGGGLPARIRSRFPETLYWNPELVTDRFGRASLELPLADSITTWKLLATGSTEHGLLGSASLDLRVFQDFFVDVELPVALTQGDRVSVPVTVYNYLKTRQRVTVRLAREPWFEARGPLEQTIELEPSQVGARRFTIVARRIGRQELTVHASSASGGAASAADAIRRQVQVEPDGVEHATTHAGTLRAAKAGASEELLLTIPRGAIAMSQNVKLSIHPGALSQTLAGMEGMLRMPSGCFEQTSSSTYPNVLILDTLRRTGALSKAIEERAKHYISLGYQRLIGFEVQGGGFSWFGNAPANRILTAYGLLEFKDMSRVHPVDPALIARTARWLAKQQLADGSWPPDQRMILDGAGNAYTRDRLRITAYIAGALRHAGYVGPEVKRALGYVRKHAPAAKDPYTLAVVASLLARDGDADARAVLERLWRERREGEKGIWFEGPQATLTHGAGQSGKLETTALAAVALLRSPSPPREIGRVLDTLTAEKDSFGSWYSTQATILSLQALLLQHERSRSRPEGTLEVLVDGAARASLRLRGEDQTHDLDLTRQLGAAGTRKVALRFQGKGNLQYQLVGRYWLPRGQLAPAVATPGAAAPTLALAARYDRDRARAGESFALRVEVKNQGRKQVEMPLVSLPLPPGFSVDEDVLAALVRGGQVEKVQRIGNRAVLYLARLRPGEALRFSLGLESKHPLRVQARPGVVYEYYRPENRAESQPRILEVL